MQNSKNHENLYRDLKKTQNKSKESWEFLGAEFLKCLTFKS